MTTMIHTPESAALIEAYKALAVLAQADSGFREYISAVDPKSIEQADGAIKTILETGLTPQQLVTILPSGTTVAVTTANSRDGEETFGEVRDYPDGLRDYETTSGQVRRITTRGGWELMTGPENPLTSLRITTADEHRAAR